MSASEAVAAGAATPFAAAAIGALGLQLVSDVLFDFAPIAIERRDEFAVARDRPVWLFPGRALGVLENIILGIAQIGEEFLPFGIDRCRIFLITRVQFLDIVGIATIEKRGERKNVVGLFLTCHDCDRSPRSVSLDESSPVQDKPETLWLEARMAPWIGRGGNRPDPCLLC